jgi:hypothetical protein
MSNRHASSSMTLRVLGHRDEDGWSAHCLETDLVGRGKRFQDALSDLVELTEMQVSFAVQTKQLSLLDHPAPPEIWQVYERVAQEHLKNLHRPSRGANMALGSLPLPEAKGRMAWCGA